MGDSVVEDTDNPVNLPGTPDPTEVSLGCGACYKGFNDTPDTVPLNRLDNQEDQLQTKLCILNESVNLSDVTLPDSLKELFLAQFDR